MKNFIPKIVLILVLAFVSLTASVIINIKKTNKKIKNNTNIVEKQVRELEEKLGKKNKDFILSTEFQISDIELLRSQNKNMMRELLKQNRDKGFYESIIDYTDDQELLSKAYAGLANLYSKENKISDLLKSIKYYTYSLNIQYSSSYARELSEFILSKNTINIEFDNLEKFNNWKKGNYHLLSAQDEVDILKKLSNYKNDEVKNKALYRLSFIYLKGKNFFGNEIAKDYSAAVEAQKLMKVDNKNKEVIDISLVIDNKYSPHAGVVISSALMSSDFDSYYRFHIVSSSESPISEESRGFFNQLKEIRDFEIEFVELSKERDQWLSDNMKGAAASLYPKIVCYRLFLPELLPNLKRIIYLDSDILVNEDLQRLWKSLDNTNYMIRGVPDVFSFTHAPRFEFRSFSTYTNTGVLVINLELLKTKTGLIEKYIESDDFKDKCPYPDQDIVNHVLNEDILRLPNKWNFCPGFYPGRQRAFIYHFLFSKPWYIPNQGKDLESYKREPYVYQEEPYKDYWNYRNITPWKSE